MTTSPHLTAAEAALVAADKKIADNPWCPDAFAGAAACFIAGRPTFAGQLAEARSFIENRTDGPLTAFGFMARASRLAAMGVGPAVAAEALFDSLRKYGWLSDDAATSLVETGS